MKFPINDKEHSIEDLFQRVQVDKTDSEKLDVKPYSYWKSVARLFFRKPVSIISLIMILIVVALAIFIPLSDLSFREHFFDLNLEYRLWEPLTPWEYTPASRYEMARTLFDGADFWTRFSFYLEHPFGFNSWGGDIWRLTWWGTNLSLQLAVVVSLINVSLGIVIGSLWGYFRRIDPIMIELRNFVNNIPQMLLNMLLIYVLRPSFGVLVFVMCLFGWMGLANFIRNQIIIINNREYNLASKTLGSKPIKMILHNLLPYLVSVIVTVVARTIPSVITAEVGLTFFGLGFDTSKEVTLGSMMTLGYNTFMDFPHTLLWPALVASILSLSFFLMGLNLADATDPKNHR
jgi:oligopeptide transport system permease protein